MPITVENAQTKVKTLLHDAIDRYAKPISPEKIQIPTVFHNLIVRHGEPVAYADPDARLSLKGRIEASKFGDQIAEIFKWNRDSEFIVALWHGGRKRHLETADIIKDKLLWLRTVLEARRVIVVERLNYSPHLNPGQALLPLMKAGIPREELYPRWLGMSQKELKGIGAQTPDEVEDNLLSLLQAFTECSLEVPLSRPVLDILVTSETSLGALVQNRFPDQDLKMNFCEVLQVDTGKVGPGGELTTDFTFRGETLTQTPWVLSDFTSLN